MAVVTTPSLNGEVIETYSLKLARRLGLGRKGYNDGVMLLVAPNERKVRIEVGRGLEQTMTNAEAKAILETHMIASFRARQYDKGVADGIDAMIREVQ